MSGNTTYLWDIGRENATLADLDLNSTNDTYGYLNPSEIFGPKRDSLSIVLPITIAYVLIFITGVIGNLCTCVVITRNKSMHTATNYYLFSLAISDLLLLISGMPQEIYSIWSKWPYVFGETFCILRGLAAETSTNASVLTITFFTIERYVAICHPFLSHTMSKLSRAVKHILMVWVISFTLALPQALQFGIRVHRGVTMCLQTRIIIEHSFEISSFVFFFAPMVLISVLYALIAIRLSRARRKNKNGCQVQRFGLRVSDVHRKHGQSTRRVVKMLVAVVVAFFICWAPFHAQRLVAIYGTSDNHQARNPTMLLLYYLVTYVSGVLYYLSTSINPILYHIMSHKFREAFKGTIARWWYVGPSSAQRDRCTYSPLPFRTPNSNSAGEHSSNSAKDETRFSDGSVRQNMMRTNSRHSNTSNLARNGLALANINELNVHSKEGIVVCNSCLRKTTASNAHIIPATDKQTITTHNNLWSFFYCTSAENSNKQKKVEMKFSQSRKSIQGNISNSSLQEAKKEDLQDEMTIFMKGTINRD